MLSLLWNDFITTYRLYIGTGSLLVLFVVAAGIVVMGNRQDNEETTQGVWPYILSVWGVISIAVVKVLTAGFDLIDNKYGKYVKVALKAAFVLMLIFVLVISGKRIIAPEYYSVAENNMHIPSNLLDAMNVILGDSNEGTAKVVTMHDTGIYFESYSSRLATLYKDPIDGDVSGFDSDIREAYIELGEKYPDMRIVADAAKSNGCNYVVIRNDAYWPKEPLEKYGYNVIATCGDWDVYRNSEEVGLN